MHRRLFLSLMGWSGVVGGGIALTGGCRHVRQQGPIRVGLLHSLTGTMAISETSVVDATLLGIAEINDAGGLLGREIQPIVADGESDWPTFARTAERLIVEDEVVTVFGCWTSASRKMVKPIFEKHDHLLIYPVQYEGLEQSPNIVYTGAAPNQQILPAVAWSLENVGHRFFLLGSDYVFPRTANAIIRDYLSALGGEVVGEEYLLLGTEDVGGVVERIQRARPSMILNTINGDTNVAFFQALRQAGIKPADIPVMSFSIAEQELRSFGDLDLAGDYATWNYFQSLGSETNRKFVEKFRTRYGDDRVTSDPLEAAYLGTKLWAQAVTQAGVANVNAIRRAIRRQSYDAPGGMVYVDPDTQHTWKHVRIGRIDAAGQFDIVWDSQKPVRPVPFPVTRDRDTWRQFLAQLQESWSGEWANPGT